MYDSNLNHGLSKWLQGISIPLRPLSSTEPDICLSDETFFFIQKPTLHFTSACILGSRALPRGPGCLELVGSLCVTVGPGSLDGPWWLWGLSCCLYSFLLCKPRIAEPGIIETQSEISGRDFRAHLVQCLQFTGKEDEVQAREEACST